ncbi:MAG: serine/threonine protein kinase, partial [Thiolinea sp.]
MNIGNYAVEREIGKGGMATVYLARHKLLDRQVAFKMMDPALGREQGFSEKFINEGRIVASLEHDHIVKVYDVGISKEHQTIYMAMEYLPGGSLKEYLQSTSSVPCDRAKKILSQVGAGLELAHQKGFIHRDIKPGNILFRQDGSAVLTDFGIAKFQDSIGDLTRMGYTLGTARYMSPEQATTTTLDNRSDIYSLALVFFEMLTGKAAVAAESTVQAIHSHVSLPPPQLPDNYSYLQPVLNTALAKSPEDRYRTVSAFIDAVHQAEPDTDGTRILTAAAIASANGAPGSEVVSDQRNRSAGEETAGSGIRLLWLSMASVVFLVAVIGAFLFFWNDTDRSADSGE